MQNFIDPFFGSGAVPLSRPHPPKTETFNDAHCVGPATNILRADLTWARALDVKVGDRLVGFDESNGPASPGLRAPSRYRRLAHATVTAVARLIKPCYRLTFSDGTEVVASADHLWLSGSHTSAVTGGRGWRWLKTEGMVCNRKTQRSYVLKVADVEHCEDSWEAGWLAGILDGEGHLTVGPGLQILLSQNPGPVLDRAESLLADRGFVCTRQGSKRCQQLRVNGGMASVLSLLMRIRPGRLLAKLPERLSKVSLYGRQHRAVGLVKKVFIGRHPVVAITTDCHTFIAEGLASHNCFVPNFWRAVQADPEAVARFADEPVSEVDLHARHSYLMKGEGAAEFREKVRADPKFFDAERAGWWVWGLCSWIGSGWCSDGELRADDTPRRKTPHPEGRGTNWRQKPSVGDPTGMGVHGQSQQIPHLTEPVGVHGRHGRPQLADAYDIGRGVHARHELATCAERRAWLVNWFGRLRDRFRLARFCCGDWSRVCSSKSTLTRLGLTGVFLDPPYLESTGRQMGLYAKDSGTVADKVRKWCLKWGDDPLVRIGLAGLDGEHVELESHGWTCESWECRGGYNNRTAKGKANAKAERIWFNQSCLRPNNAAPTLFDGLGDEGEV